MGSCSYFLAIKMKASTIVCPGGGGAGCPNRSPFLQPGMIVSCEEAPGASPCGGGQKKKTEAGINRSTK